MACGMRSIVERIPNDASEEDIIAVIEKLNNDSGVSAILLQLPLPKGLDERKIVNTIAPCKDADGLTDASLGALFAARKTIAPCTAIGIVHLLEENGIQIEGKNVVVIGRSLLVGKSVANLLEQKNATVTICHSRTRDLSEHTKRADIVVVAIGKPKFLTADMVKDGAVVVDVGINRTESGLIGDVDFDSVKEKASWITPVPGGVGPMTIAELLSNTLILHEMKNKKEYL